MNVCVKPHRTVTFEEWNGVSVHLRWLDIVAEIASLNVAKKQKYSLNCSRDVIDPGDIVPTS